MHLIKAGVLACATMALSLSATAQEAPRLNRPADNDNLPRKEADLRHEYGSHKSQFVDLRVPEGPGPFPVAVVIHGGCWITPYANLRNSGAFADALRDEGIASLNIEYRPVDQEGGGWPGTFYDVADAIDSLRFLATDHPLDLQNIMAIGHSAGGHLALWALARPAMSERAPIYQVDPLPLKGAISVGGPGDLLAAREPISGPCGIDAITPLLGGEQLREMNANWGSPAEILPFKGEQILITGDQDQVAPPAMGDQYVTRAEEEVGIHIRHIIVENAGHHEYWDPNAVTWPIILSAIRSILD